MTTAATQTTVMRMMRTAESPRLLAGDCRTGAEVESGFGTTTVLNKHIQGVKLSN